MAIVGLLELRISCLGCPADFSCTDLVVTKATTVRFMH
jgi:hypothetical protein